MILKASKKNLIEALDTLSSYNSCPESPGITRMMFSTAELEARAYIKKIMCDTGLVVTEDAIGNIYGTLRGENPGLAPVWTGSHIDTVRSGGLYDGAVGVVGGIEACRMIKESKAKHERDITVVVFSSEEPTRFGVGCVGSRAMAGHLPLETTKNLQDENGISLYSELERLGYTQLDYNSVLKNPGEVFASVELHIEQGPHLEAAACPIGIVEAICAPTYINVIFEGKQDHAGSTPMNVRRDAMVAAADVIIKLEDLARSYADRHTVATVGRLMATPNSSNVIAGRVELFIDIRSINEKSKNDLTKKICAYIDNVALLRDIKSTCKVLANDRPKASNQNIMAAIQSTCDDMGIHPLQIVSGAYHDSLFVGEFAPMGMVFIPSHDGISHDPDEFTNPEDIVLGTEVLANTLVSLANRNEI